MILYITFIVYFFIVFAIGSWAYYQTNTHSDYVLGGRRLSALVTALGAGASDMSGWLITALPGAIYVFGFSKIWMPIGLTLGAYLNWRFLAYRLRVFTLEADNALTIPSYLESRFHDKNHVLRTLTALVLIFFFTIYSASSFVSSALLFSTIFGMDYHVALLISVLVIVLYTSLGGFLAVNWVDVFQGTLMLGALLVLPWVVWNTLGGLEGVIAHGNQIHSPHYFHWLTGISGFEIASAFAWGLGYFGQPHILVRFMAAKTPQAIARARQICMSWMVLSLGGAVLIGLLGRLYYAAAPLSDPEQVFYALVHTLAHDWLSGGLLAAALSCILSTVAAQLLLSSTALAHDIYHARFKQHASTRQLLWIERVTVFLVALCALLLAWNQDSSVLSLVGHAWAGLGASFGPVLLSSLFIRRMTGQAAIAGIVTGSVTVMGWIIAQQLWPAVSFLRLYEMVPGFVASFVAICCVVQFDKKPSKAVLELFDRADRICRAG